MEQQERQKQLEQAAKPASQLPAESATLPTINPPNTGEPVSNTTGPYGSLPVAEIDAGYQEAVEKEELAAREAANGTGPEATTTVIPSESEQAPIHHG